jgi:hypothetical protein
VLPPAPPWPGEIPVPVPSPYPPLTPTPPAPITLPPGTGATVTYPESPLTKLSALLSGLSALSGQGKGVGIGGGGAAPVTGGKSPIQSIFQLPSLTAPVFMPPSLGELLAGFRRQ